MSVSVVILTFNAEETIGATLTSAFLVSDDVHVVDSYSTDGTLEICQAFGAHIVSHPFENYGAQRNWAIATLPLKYPWQLHLDADERLSPELVEAIRGLKVDPSESDMVGYFVPRLVHFMGRPIKHGGMYPIWHLRIFKTGYGRCEARRYDQHFLAQGPTDRLHAPMIDDMRMSLSEWTARHNRWSDAEAEELTLGSADADRNGLLVKPNFLGNPSERKRALRSVFNAAPLFLRPFMLFIYRYVFRLGFLDGKPGLIFFILQTFWFRFLVDAKLYEKSNAADHR
ncbi:MAG: glycosyltransferase family 2 protein [Thiocapsa sp.]|uniref:glycosyltransferase family 2 protein n=1 Tax=Thiocapsa sp. TaxID=2024551 RepID=UPI001BCEB8A0|nr:glycosyltransferase family 2 protein [Thiocapsa sp.]QVL48719.1 MAG: glycosyltransferase family 2 protein [Thiocapsa sp.]